MDMRLRLDFSEQKLIFIDKAISSTVNFNVAAKARWETLLVLCVHVILPKMHAKAPYPMRLSCYKQRKVIAVFMFLLSSSYWPSSLSH